MTTDDVRAADAVEFVQNARNCERLLAKCHLANVSPPALAHLLQETGAAEPVPTPEMESKKQQLLFQMRHPDFVRWLAAKLGAM